MLSVVNAERDRPHPVKCNRSQSITGSEHQSVVKHHPDTTQYLAERPVAEHQVDRVEVHGHNGHQHVGEREILNDGGEGGSQFLLNHERCEYEEVGAESDDDEDKHAHAEEDLRERNGTVTEDC